MLGLSFPAPLVLPVDAGNRPLRVKGDTLERHGFERTGGLTEYGADLVVHYDGHEYGDQLWLPERHPAIAGLAKIGGTRLLEEIKHGATDVCCIPLGQYNRDAKINPFFPEPGYWPNGSTVRWQEKEKFLEHKIRRTWREVINFGRLRELLDNARGPQFQSCGWNQYAGLYWPDSAKEAVDPTHCLYYVPPNRGRRGRLLVINAKLIRRAEHAYLIFLMDAVPWMLHLYGRVRIGPDGKIKDEPHEEEPIEGEQLEEELAHKEMAEPDTTATDTAAAPQETVRDGTPPPPDEPPPSTQQGRRSSRARARGKKRKASSK